MGGHLGVRLLSLLRRFLLRRLIGFGGRPRAIADGADSGADGGALARVAGDGTDDGSSGRSRDGALRSGT